MHTLASFNRRKRMKAESRQIPQKLATRLKFAYCFTELLSLDKCICTKTRNNTYSVYHYCHCFIYVPIKLEGIGSHWDTCLDNFCFFSAQTFIILKSRSGALNSAPPNKCVHLYTNCGLLKVASEQ